MRTSTQIWVDKYIGHPIAIGLNLLARILGAILRINHSLDRKLNTIAICKLKGMGSIVQATPLLQTLRTNYPEAHIVFISAKGNEMLLRKLPMIDELHIINDKNIFALIGSTLKVWWKIKLRIDVYLDLEIYSNFSSILTTLSMARNRVGYYLRSGNYRLGMYTHIMFFNTRAPISEAYLQFARLLNCKEIIRYLYQPPIPAQDVRNILPYRPYIVINPNASDLRVERRWGRANYIKLIEVMLDDFPDYDIVLVGSQDEVWYVNSIEEAIDPNYKARIINTAGDTSLNELLLLLAKTRLLISNDTGPMHLAFALKTPTVALFGPCHPRQYGQAENCVPIYKNVYCSPCVHEFFVPPCKGNNQCMQLIKVDEVVKAIGMMLDEEEIIRDSTFMEFTYSRDEVEISPLGLVQRKRLQESTKPNP